MVNEVVTRSLLYPTLVVAMTFFLYFVWKGVYNYIKPKSSIVVITLETSDRVFPSGMWSQFRKGVTDAASDLDLNITYVHPDVYENIPGQVADLIREYTNSVPRPDALITTIPHRYTLPAIEFARTRVPLVSVNAGSTLAAGREENTRLHVGQNEKRAGKDLTNYFLKKYSGAPIAVILPLESSVQNGALVDRLDGILEAHSQAARFSSTYDPAFQEFINGQSQVVIIYVDSYDLVESQIPENARVGTFDVDRSIIDLIRREVVEATIDQQAYQQGYLSVAMANLIKTYGITFERFHFVGGILVTADNVGDYYKTLFFTKKRV